MAVVDLMLPGIDGWRITETLRAEGIALPIINRQRPRLRARQGARARGSAATTTWPSRSACASWSRASRGRCAGPGRARRPLGRPDRGAGAGDRPRPAPGHAGGRRRRPDPTEFRLLYVLASERAGRSAATSSSSACGGRPTATATAPWTCASASCAKSSTAGRRPTPTSRRTTASATGSSRSRSRPSRPDGGGRRQHDADRRALARRTVDLGAAAVLLGDVLDDGEAEARARARACALDPVEPLEDAGQVLGSCRRPCPDPQLDRAGEAARADGHRGTGAGVGIALRPGCRA